MSGSRSRRPGRVACAALVLAAAACGGSGSPAGTPPAPAAPPAGAGANTATAADFAGQPAARAEELFVGRFPGVRVLRLSDGSLAIRVRGAGAFQGGGEPLYVVDGTPMDTNAGGGLAGVNPYDIARIQVLKDIAQTSFYGVRGANGVVLITTKRRQ
jgi:TonB-dependent SusC/RagA subfamily outer membrane receptor